MGDYKQNKRILISGGGTGGHMYPAISIANALRKINPKIEILFVGANGKIEMTKVPQAGYDIIGLDIAGFDRKHMLKNIKVLWLLFLSLIKARRIIKDFKPNAVVGVGGYASGPVGFWATRMNIPIILQEQNSYAGVTNKLLAKKAAKICVAYENMERFFEKEKIVLTGNPIRVNSFTNINREEAYQYFGLNAELPTLCVVGGSLGAKSINEAMKKQLLSKKDSIPYQIIWQTGKLYFSQIKEEFKEIDFKGKLVLKNFIDRMDYLFAIADVIVSRAGAGTISELCMIAKPVILVPSPNVAEDHQTQNAKALVLKKAAIMVKDSELQDKLFVEIEKLMNNDELKKSLNKNIVKLAKPEADIEIAKIILEEAR